MKEQHGCKERRRRKWIFRSHYQDNAFELEKQLYKWQKLEFKKLKLATEKLKLETELMEVEIKHREGQMRVTGQRQQ